jgi:ATP-dependent DNA ligase
MELDSSGRDGFIEPCLPSPAPNPPAGDGWIHEIKLDGFRMLARRDGAGVRLLTRRGIDWTTRYPAIAAAIAALACRSCLDACKLGFEGIVSKRLGSPYVSGRSRHWIKSKNPAAPAVKREAEEDWGAKRWR